MDILKDQLHSSYYYHFWRDKLLLIQRNTKNMLTFRTIINYKYQIKYKQMNQLSPKGFRQRYPLKNQQTKSTYFFKKFSPPVSRFESPIPMYKKNSNPQPNKPNLPTTNKFTNFKSIKTNLENFKSLQKDNSNTDITRQTKQAFYKNFIKEKSFYKISNYSQHKVQDNSDYSKKKLIENILPQPFIQNEQYKSRNKDINTEGKSIRRRTKSTHLSSNQLNTLEKQKVKQNSPESFKKDNFKIIQIQKMKFIIIKALGSGRFSNVYMVKHMKTGFVGAMKIIKKELIVNDKLINQIIREIKIHSFINHPGLIKLYNFFQDHKNLYLFQELGCDGQLYSILKKKKRFSQQATSFIIRNLLKAISYLHSHKILHRDIKPENIIITHGNIKLCDFGCSVYTINNTLRSTFCGSPVYISPEIVKGQKYNETIDIWAIGILTYQLFYGNAPFQIYQQEQIFKIVTDEIFYPEQISISAELRDFIQKILKKNPLLRLKCDSLLSHPFILKYQLIEICDQLCFQ